MRILLTWLFGELWTSEQLGLEVGIAVLILGRKRETSRANEECLLRRKNPPVLGNLIAKVRIEQL